MTEAGGGYFRASHADRERVVDLLKAAYTQGRLTEDELEAQVARALGSRIYAELAVVTADLPAWPAASRLTPGQARKPANLTPFLGGVGVFTVIPVILIAMGLRLGNEDMAGIGVVLFAVELLVFILAWVVAVGTVIDSRMKNRRADAQPPPGPRGTPPSGGMPCIAFSPGPARPEARDPEARDPEARRGVAGAPLPARSRPRPGAAGFLTPRWRPLE